MARLFWATKVRNHNQLASWRRREGVEPSGDLTAPRLVLKTSGTTGHLPSPHLKNNWLTRMLGPVKVECVVTNVAELLVR